MHFKYTIKIKNDYKIFSQIKTKRTPFLSNRQKEEKEITRRCCTFLKN